ncbi:hypothetical protein DOTSEDRAFT_21577 [Dothistroma septosporum NZE10]|uniref:C2H2-type domain-containing protein n=1 Tax=Dothistroma septosporum (strain NZE10 / CBS 128990) TaxID=675120 RepID=N1PZL0_DOTSN|nr:hypothetical protein DOTSEDRAFT_21577 [Dothistroma septosporum NZE10]
MAKNNGNPSMQAMQAATTGYYSATKHLSCPFEGCDQRFTCKHNVNQHVREAHTGERPYECHICAEKGDFTAFSRPASLYRHQRGVHNYEPNIRPRGRPRGLHGPRAKKSVGRNDAPISATPVNDKVKANNHNDYTTHQRLQEACQKAVQNADPSTQPCWLCPIVLPAGQEALLLHGHMAHDDPFQMKCACSICTASFAQEIAATCSSQDRSNRSNQPLSTRQAPLVQQPKPMRTLDIDFLSTLDKRLMRVKATRISNDDIMSGVASGSNSETDATDPDDMVGLVSSDISKTPPIQTGGGQSRADSAIGSGHAFEQGDINDYAKPLDLSESLEDFLRNITDDYSSADEHMCD